MHPEGEEMTAFRHQGVFYYHLMSFGQQNAWATYQHVTIVIFNEMLGDTVIDTKNVTEKEIVLKQCETAQAKNKILMLKMPYYHG